MAVTAEQKVRDTAKAFAKALAQASEEGLVVTWPLSPAGLETISISETAAAIKTAEPIETPAGTAVVETPKGKEKA